MPGSAQGFYPVAPRYPVARVTPVEPDAREGPTKECDVNDENPESPASRIPVEPVPAEPASEDAVSAVPLQAEPVEDPVASEPEPSVDAEADAGSEEPSVDGTGVVAASDDTALVPQAAEESAPSTPVQTVYVHAPVPPRKKGNRGIGSLIALGSAIIFAVLYAGVVFAVVPLFAPPRAVGFEFLGFISSAAFFVPVLVFALGFIVLVLVLNRAGWWAYILGSLVVGVFVYVVSIGLLLLVSGIVGSTLDEGLRLLRSALQSPVTITAGIVGREVALWMGAAIAARARRVKARNAESRAAYDRDTARARADYERAVAANASR